MTGTGAVSRTYDIALLQLMGLFERVTHAKVKDVLYFKEMPTFIVEEGQLMRALGPHNLNVAKLEKMLGKRVKIVEFRQNVTEFVRNLLIPYRTTLINQEGSVIYIEGQDTKTNGLIIGARAQNLRAYESIVQRYFPEITEMKVVS
jgi:NusA-like KH domain protein